MRACSCAGRRRPRRNLACAPPDSDDAGPARVCAGHCHRRRAEALFGFYQRGGVPGSFEAGIESALRFMLAESGVRLPPRNASRPMRRPGRPYRISDIELASRLSFFLWSSIPDEELLDLAASGEAASPEVLERRCGGCSPTGVADAWSTTSPASGYTCATSTTSPRTCDCSRTSTTTCGRRSARRPNCSSTSVVREDRSVLDLLKRRPHLPQRAARKHYGIPHVYGSRFRRVDARRHERFGLLRQRSILPRHLVRQPHVARASAANGFSKTSSAPRRPPPPPNDPALPGTRRRHRTENDAAADGTAPRQPGVRRVPPGCRGAVPSAAASFSVRWRRRAAGQRRKKRRRGTAIRQVVEHRFTAQHGRAWVFACWRDEEHRALPEESEPLRRRRLDAAEVVAFNIRSARNAWRAAR